MAIWRTLTKFSQGLPLDARSIIEISIRIRSKNLLDLDVVAILKLTSTARVPIPCERGTKADSKRSRITFALQLGNVMRCWPEIRNVGTSYGRKLGRPTFHLFAGPWRINLPGNCVRLSTNGRALARSFFPRYFPNKSRGKIWQSSPSKSLQLERR